MCKIWAKSLNVAPTSGFGKRGMFFLTHPVYLNPTKCGQLPVIFATKIIKNSRFFLPWQAVGWHEWITSSAIESNCPSGLQHRRMLEFPMFSRRMLPSRKVISLGSGIKNETAQHRSAQREQPLFGSLDRLTAIHSFSWLTVSFLRS